MLRGKLVSLGNLPKTWRTKKQGAGTKSSSEAEDHAMAAITSELIWLKSFLASLGVYHKTPMKVYCDNQMALHIARNPVFQDRTKHIEIDCHFIRQHLMSGSIEASHVRSKDQLADIFTKALGGEIFENLQKKMGIISTRLSPLGGVLEF